MHLLLDISSIALFTYGSFLALSKLRQLPDWSRRQYVQCFILVAPLIGLALGIAELCMQFTMTWDTIISLILLLTMTLFVAGAFGLSLVRLALMTWFVAQHRGTVDPQLQALADMLARRLGTTRPRVLLCVSDCPLAFTYGLFRSTVVLSTWMLDMLDQHELEAVLAHELEHVARRDYLVTWLATTLRDAFFYLPTSHIAYHQLRSEKELACDDLVVKATQRPLALASALAKVWLHTVEGPRLARMSTAQSFEGAGESLNGRIERLLTRPGSPGNIMHVRTNHLPISISTVMLLLISQTVSTMLMFALMGCGPVLLLGRVF